LNQARKGFLACVDWVMNFFVRVEEFLVHRLHALGGQRAGVLDLLLADLAEARVDRGVVFPAWPPNRARRAGGSAG
jgi:hypothetical protein